MRNPRDKKSLRESNLIAEKRKEICSRISAYKLTDAMLDGITYNGRKGYFKSDRFKLEYQRDVNNYKVIRVGDHIEYGHHLALRILGIDIRGMDVHHINLIRDDNRFSNLRVMKREDHRALHAALRSSSQRRSRARERSDRKPDPLAQ